METAHEIQAAHDACRTAMPTACNTRRSAVRAVTKRGTYRNSEKLDELFLKSWTLFVAGNLYG
jgi:hypothetical protein